MPETEPLYFKEFRMYVEFQFKMVNRRLQFLTLDKKDSLIGPPQKMGEKFWEDMEFLKRMREE